MKWEGWCWEKAYEALDAYALFFTLKLIREDYHDQELWPTEIIDKVWQLHILDTRGYWKCSQILAKGKFIHRVPDHHSDGALDQVEARVINTLKAYMDYFGEKTSENDECWMFGRFKGQELFKVCTIQEGECKDSILHRQEGSKVVFPKNRTMLLPRDMQASDLLIKLGVQSKEGFMIYDLIDNSLLPLSTRLNELRTRQPIWFMGPEDVAKCPRPLTPRCTEQIFFKDFAGKTRTLLVDVNKDGDCVWQVKQMIQVITGIKASRMRAIHSGKQLEDDNRLFDCKVGKASSLHVVGRLSGC